MSNEPTNKMSQVVNLENVSWVCSDCMANLGRKIPHGHLATFHDGICGLCGERKTVTEPRDYRENWLDKKYHLFKKSRLYIGLPYNGPTSKNEPAAYDTLGEAIEARALFEKINPVGWDIYDSENCVKINPERSKQI